MAAAMLGGALMSASIQVFNDKMASRDVLEFFRRKKLNDLLPKKLKLKLLSANVLLKDAEEKQIRNPDVREWIAELLDAIYDADDLLNDINSEALRCQWGGESGSTGNITKSQRASYFCGLDKNCMAAAMLGGALMSASIQVFNDKMASRDVLEFFRRRKLNDLLLKMLKLKLLSANVPLQDAEEKQIRNPDVREWIAELQDAIYGADDLLNDINSEALRCQWGGESGSTGNSTISLVLNFFSTTYAAFNNNVELKRKVIVCHGLFL